MVVRSVLPLLLLSSLIACTSDPQILVTLIDQVKPVSGIVGAQEGFCQIVDGDLACWGNTLIGGAVPPTDVVIQTGRKKYYEGKEISYISMALANTCMVSNGGAYCVGSSLNGQLGRGGGVIAGKNYNFEPVKNLGPGSGVVQVATSSFASFALTNTSEVYAWGSNSAGLIGTQGEPEDYDPGDYVVTLGGGEVYSAPIKIELPLNNIQFLVAGYAHACVAGDNGGDSEIWCWGANTFGETGQDPAVYPFHRDPMRVETSNLGIVKFLTASAFGTRFVTLKGTYSIGEQPGTIINSTQETGYSHIPFKIEGLPSDVTQIKSETVTCVIAGGRAYCVGAQYGSDFQMIDFFDGEPVVEEVAIALTSICAVSSSSDTSTNTECVGRNNAGQDAQQAEVILDPTLIQTFDKTVTLSAGGSSSCFVLREVKPEDNVARCFGGSIAAPNLGYPASDRIVGPMDESLYPVEVGADKPLQFAKQVFQHSKIHPLSFFTTNTTCVLHGRSRVTPTLNPELDNVLACFGSNNDFNIDTEIKPDLLVDEPLHKYYGRAYNMNTFLDHMDPAFQSQGVPKPDEVTQDGFWGIQDVLAGESGTCMLIASDPDVNDGAFDPNAFAQDIFCQGRNGTGALANSDKKVRENLFNFDTIPYPDPVGTAGAFPLIRAERLTNLGDYRIQLMNGNTRDSVFASTGNTICAVIEVVDNPAGPVGYQTHNTVVCWGKGNEGGIGDGGDDIVYPPGTLVPPTIVDLASELDPLGVRPRILEITASLESFCIVVEDVNNPVEHYVLCWGSRSSSIIQGNSNFLIPTIIPSIELGLNLGPGGDRVIDLDSSIGLLCFLVEERGAVPNPESSVHCSGYNFLGQLGKDLEPSFGSSPAMEVFSGQEGPESVHVGLGHVFAVFMEAGIFSVYGWGHNQEKQIGYEPLSEWMNYDPVVVKDKD